MLKLIKYSNDLMKKNNQIKNWDNGKLRSKVQIIQKGLVLERMKFNFMKENVL